MNQHIAFIGGGNMASAIIGGLVRQGFTPAQIIVIEPFVESRQKLHRDWGLTRVYDSADAALHDAGMVVWAVKPQVFQEATYAVRNHTPNALHLSVAAGIRSSSIAQWLGSERIIRSMPNTPALIGKGITALYARAAVTSADKAWAEQVVESTGEFLWLTEEAQLDAVTALSGSGPAYMFYLMEAMRDAGVAMGLDAADAYRLAVATFIGAGELAKGSSESAEVLRQRVTSKGGTTHAAITAMDERQLKPLFTQALFAAHARAQEMGDAFGGDAPIADKPSAH